MNDEFEKLARRMLATDEGLYSRPYDDATGEIVRAPKGNLSVGIGHNLVAKPLRQEVIDLIFKLDLQDAVREAKNVVGETLFESLSVNRQLALVNLAFNLGEAGLRKFSKMLAALRVGDYQWAGAHLRDSLWAVQVDPKRRPDVGRDDRVIKLLAEDINDYQETTV